MRPHLKTEKDIKGRTLLYGLSIIFYRMLENDFASPGNLGMAFVDNEGRLGLGRNELKNVRIVVECIGIKHMKLQSNEDGNT